MAISKDRGPSESLLQLPMALNEFLDVFGGDGRRLALSFGEMVAGFDVEQFSGFSEGDLGDI